MYININYSSKMEEIYIVNNKSELCNFLNDKDNLFIMIEIFFNYALKKIKPIKIQKYISTKDIPVKLSDLYSLNNNLLDLCIELNLYNLQQTNTLYKSFIEIEMFIIDELSSDNKIKINYSKKIFP